MSEATRTAQGDPRPLSLPDLGDRLPAAVAFGTTEHFTLQTARSTTVAEAGNRATSYLAALSSTLIALAFIGNMSGLSAVFFLFCSLLLPVLTFIGIVSFARLVQSTNEDIALAGRIARLRSFYVELVPELEPYLDIGRRGSVPGSLSEEREEPSKRQLFLTVAGMIAVVNSVVIGTTCGFAGMVTSNPMVASSIAGVIGASTSLVAQFAHQLRVVRQHDELPSRDAGVLPLAHLGSRFSPRRPGGGQLISLAYLICRSLFRLLACAVRRIDDKDVEIVVLRHQLDVLHRQNGRPRFRTQDRMLLAALSRLLPRPRWRSFLVRPDTLMRWHRQLVTAKARRWGRKSPGRPPTAPQLKNLVLRIARENPRWGYMRIRGELLKLGRDLPVTTIRDILRRAGIGPTPRRDGPGWTQFLRAQATTIVACDFFTAYTL
jgi:hypothetical protein